MNPPLSVQASRRTLAALTVCQAFLFTNNTILIIVGAVAGHALAPDKRLATLPVTAGVIGGAVTTFFASLLMQRIGRRAGFTLGSLFGIAGVTICSLGLASASFVTFCLGALVLGAYNAFGGYYRFAAAEAAQPGQQARAISMVLLSGLMGGVVGPFVTNRTKDLFPTEHLGTYLSLFALLAVVLVAQRFIVIPTPVKSESAAPARSARAIASEPVFVVAVLAAAFGFGVMSLLMTSTPLAMTACGHAYSDVGPVISSHVVAMFAPALFTGRLIQRFGVLSVMLVGVVLNLACIGIALSGVDVPNFMGALVLLGIGWNFLYIGGTTLLAETVRPGDKARAQGMNDLTIFATMVLSSFSSGVIVEDDGWRMLNLAAVPFVLFVGVAILWLRAKRIPLARPA